VKTQEVKKFLYVFSGRSRKNIIRDRSKHACLFAPAGACYTVQTLLGQQVDPIPNQFTIWVG